MTDMTVQQHNEQLVLEKKMIEQQARQTVDVLGRIIVALMGKYRNKKITPAQWEKAGGHPVMVKPDDDGGWVIRVEEPGSGAGDQLA